MSPTTANSPFEYNEVESIHPQGTISIDWDIAIASGSIGPDISCTKQDPAWVAGGMQGRTEIPDSEDESTGLPRGGSIDPNLRHRHMWGVRIGCRQYPMSATTANPLSEYGGYNNLGRLVLWLLGNEDSDLRGIIKEMNIKLEDLKLNAQIEQSRPSVPRGPGSVGTMAPFVDIFMTPAELYGTTKSLIQPGGPMAPTSKGEWLIGEYRHTVHKECLLHGSTRLPAHNSCPRCNIVLVQRMPLAMKMIAERHGVDVLSARTSGYRQRTRVAQPSRIVAVP
ncbi:hypothetical protein K491DRAFT_684156 [Lophiostoma macrostomum CBS 122681]|uniref:Uncharacterized protein n=1 Tax=Lophiostoma macrostomum CBS 122681 TaxID=1314788 RepID=A0A6A6SQ28_9PLEO|nr:hypothetical protein K491DRAFT_684156 [Lophiostoma macrostomum CBS 122681]